MTGLKRRRLDVGFLRLPSLVVDFPIVVRSENLVPRAAQFEGRIGEGAGQSAGSADAADEQLLGIGPGHNETTDQDVLAVEDLFASGDVLGARLLDDWHRGWRRSAGFDRGPKVADAGERSFAGINDREVRILDDVEFRSEISVHCLDRERRFRIKIDPGKSRTRLRVLIMEMQRDHPGRGGIELNVAGEFHVIIRRRSDAARENIMVPDDTEGNVTRLVRMPIKHAARIIAEARGRKAVSARLPDPGPVLESVSGDVVREKKPETGPA